MKLNYLSQRTIEPSATIWWDGENLLLKSWALIHTKLISELLWIPEMRVGKNGNPPYFTISFQSYFRIKYSIILLKNLTPFYLNFPRLTVEGRVVMMFSIFFPFISRLHIFFQGNAATDWCSFTRGDGIVISAAGLVLSGSNFNIFGT